MTAALNLGLLGNNVTTSGQVSLTAGVSGTLPVANGGTGAATLTANNVLLGNGTSALQAVAPSTSGNVLTSNGTTWTSAAAPVAVPSSITAIGTILIAANTTTSNYLPGNTITGSSLYYPTAITSVSDYIYTDGNNSGFYPYTNISTALGQYFLGYARRHIVGNTGYVLPLGHTALSGTWRVLTAVVARTTAYDSTYNFTVAQSPYVLVQRIS